MSLIRKYQNHTPQINQQHRKKEPHNNHKTPGRQIKRSKQLSHTHQDDHKTRKDTKQSISKLRTSREPHNGNSNQQRINNNNRTTALE